MRKIAANYIYLPGYPLVKNGYVVLDGDEVKEVVDTGGTIREIQGLEFYGGMLVAGCCAGMSAGEKKGEKLLPCLDRMYAGMEKGGRGIALIRKADLSALVFKTETVIERLV